MTRSLFMENVRLSGVENAVALAIACGVSVGVVDLWVITVVGGVK
jgi:hypothetical protein